MHVEIVRKREKPRHFLVVVADEAGRRGILHASIPSYAVARRRARHEGLNRGLPVINRVEDAVRHGKPGKKAGHFTSAKGT